ncbi:bifunctional DedA family/phosphatase PAP2 family protein [Marilutibacter spongiae]|uniref:Bifunctional DedA family/phosphatase PAP2 family protein n=1 Tax=Marilutibacter spongiae TaxID=2025720 RepID=A0A7W3Y700_9GAMM|nr:bifunctional DedA family/phosphatase PAP2 family protein [Lysobacter spongiae]MBB1061649.1 bifunctional DedA family/phosphatase PAP2 family protein [Lysobacter spongiae]
MESAWIENATAWIAAHPTAAGALIFLIAFCDALVILGIVVPALPLLFAVGAMVGLGHINGPYALAAAALGALLGDALSYWVGRLWGPQLRQRWPFSRYPQWLERSESMFRRHGVKSIFIARFVGAVRPFVPAIAGMLHMPFPRYLLPSLVACVGWAALFLAPGWILGASYEAVAAVADRLAIVFGVLLVALGLVWAIVLYTWRWSAMHADKWLARALDWFRRHPRLGRYATALVDPNRPESPSLVILALCLLAISWIWFSLLATLFASGGPLPLDHSVHTFMWSLRNPLADRMMAALASLGELPVLGTAAAVPLVYLVWRRRWMAAAHWIAAIVFGLVLTALLEAAIDMPRPPTAPAGFGFPSVSVTMATVVFGFFAVLIARELPGRKRVWPYLVAGVATTLIGFARLYLGAHWLSDIVGGTLFGIVWLLVLGLAYRSHQARSFWMRPLAWMFYGSFLAAAAWHAPRAADGLLAKFQTVEPLRIVSDADWWREDWQTLPAQRDERDVRRRWTLDLQVAGPLAPLQLALEAQGWRVQPQADWTATVGLLDDDTPAQAQPVLPATLDAQAESLLMVRALPAEPGQAPRMLALRLWPAPAALDDGTPLWLGATQRLYLARPFDLFALWRPEPDEGEAFAAVRKALAGFEQAEAVHPDTGLPVLRLHTVADPSGQ